MKPADCADYADKSQHLCNLRNLWIMVLEEVQ